MSDREPVSLWGDGLYVRAGVEKEKAAVLGVIGAMRDGTKEVLMVGSGERESTAVWKALLRSLKARGLRSPRLTIAAGHLGSWGAVAEICPESAEQRCWNHTGLNVPDHLLRQLLPQARELVGRLPDAQTQADCEGLRRQFAHRYGRTYPKAVAAVERD